MIRFVKTRFGDSLFSEGLSTQQVRNTSKSASMSHLIYQTNVILYTFWSVSSSSQVCCKIELNVLVRPNLI